MHRVYTLPRGIIPTRVGTRVKQMAKHIDVEDHPHACGDKGIKISNIETWQGSSPRVWGQVGISGLIKAFVEDHPHACGDKLSSPVFVATL